MGTASETASKLGKLAPRRKPPTAAMRQGARQTAPDGAITVLELSKQPNRPATRPVVDRSPSRVTD